MIGTSLEGLNFDSFTKKDAESGVLFYYSLAYLLAFRREATLNRTSKVIWQLPSKI